MKIIFIILISVSILFSATTFSENANTLKDHANEITLILDTFLQSNELDEDITNDLTDFKLEFSEYQKLFREYWRIKQEKDKNSFISNQNSFLELLDELDDYVTEQSEYYNLNGFAEYKMKFNSFKAYPPLISKNPISQPTENNINESDVVKVQERDIRGFVQFAFLPIKNYGGLFGGAIGTHKKGIGAGLLILGHKKKEKIYNYDLTTKSIVLAPKLIIGIETFQFAMALGFISSSVKVDTDNNSDIQNINVKLDGQDAIFGCDILISPESFPISLSSGFLGSEGLFSFVGGIGFSF